MSDLTEKWKAGKLEEGYYYIKANRTISFVEIDYYHIFGETEYWNGNDNEDVLEVLAPIPSYEELQVLKEYEKTIQSFNGMPIDYTIACETVNKLLDEKSELKQKIHILTESQMKLENTVGEFVEENARLKVLLKECMDMFVKMYSTNTVNSAFLDLYENIKVKIEEALR